MKRGKILFLLFPLSQALLLLGFYQTMGRIEGEASVGMVVGILADVVLFYVLLRNERQEKVERELEELTYLHKAEQMQKSLLEKNQEVLDAMKTAFEQQLQEIYDRLEAGDTQNVSRRIETLQKNLDSTVRETYSSHPVVNAVLSEKQQLCREKGFSMDVNVEIPRTVKVDPLHLCSIFSNLLDNAIEAVEELEQDERVIEVRGELKGHYLIVKVCNRAEKAHVERERREGRGDGTQILKDIARKYEGEYRAEYEHGQYSAVLAVKAVP